MPFSSRANSFLQRCMVRLCSALLDRLTIFTHTSNIFNYLCIHLMTNSGNMKSVCLFHFIKNLHLKFQIAVVASGLGSPLTRPKLEHTTRSLSLSLSHTLLQRSCAHLKFLLYEGFPNNALYFRHGTTSCPYSCSQTQT
jgi:hypothetical protein